MRFGDKKARYAVLNYNGNLREVVGAVFDSSQAEYTKPDNDSINYGKIGIKNNDTDTDITLYDNGTNGSYIQKNDNKVVKTYGWLESESNINVASNYTIWTHGQSINNKIAYIPNGNFEIVNWNKCTGTDLKSAFYQTNKESKGLKKVPNSWPTGCTSVAYSLKNTGITNIPSWTNLSTCTDVREAIAGTTIDDLKIDTMIDGLSSAINAKKLLNNVKVNKDLYFDERKFYEIYNSLKDQLTNAEDFFGSKSAYTVKYWFTDLNGDSAWVIPSTLIYIPSEWGGCKGDEIIGSINNDIDVETQDPIVTPISLHVNTKYCRWDISKYGSDYKAVTNNVISSFVDFYSSCRFIAKCVHIGSGTTYYYDGKDAENHFETFNGNNFIYWNIGKALMLPGEYEWTIYMFMPNNPNAIIQPEFKDNGSITPGDYYQVYNKDGKNYTGTFIVPDVDVSLSNVVLEDWDEERSSFTWNCLGKEINPVTHEESEEKIVNEYVDDWTITVSDYPSFTCNPINLQGEVTLSLSQIEEYIGEKLEPDTYTFTVVANRDNKQSSPAIKQFKIKENTDEITWCNLNNQYYHGIIVNFENSFTLNTIEAYQTDKGWTGPEVNVGKVTESGVSDVIKLSCSLQKDNTPVDFDGKITYLYTYNITNSYTFNANTDYFIVFSNAWWIGNEPILIHTKNIKSYNKGTIAVDGNISYPIQDLTKFPYIRLNGELT